MIIPDANVLLHAVNADASQHEAARSWLDGALSGPEDVGFADVAVLAFLRIATSTRVFREPLSIAAACEVLDVWLGSPSAVGLRPGDRHYPRVCELLEGTRAGGSLASDAHLAALALEHDATIGTFDRDLVRFPGVRVHLLG